MKLMGLLIALIISVSKITKAQDIILTRKGKVYEVNILKLDSSKILFQKQSR